MTKKETQTSFLTRLKKFLMFDDRVNTRRKVYSSVWAVAIGFLTASIIYWIITLTGDNPANPFSFIINLFKFALQPDGNLRESLYTYFLVFGFAGMAVAIAFKSGLFNIGISGQMQLPAILFFLFLIIGRTNFDEVSTSYLFGMFFVFFLVSMLLGGFAGFLKAYFNVHEVITTIFLNWIVTYVGVWLFTRSNFTLLPSDFPDLDAFLGTVQGTSRILLTTGQKTLFIAMGMVVLAILAIGFWFLYSNTTIGYKMKMVGLNKTNSKYVGINEKLLTIIVMAISGGLAGLAGFFFFILSQKNYPATPTPTLIGFEAIAIALIALNNPIGVLISSLLYAVIYNGQASFQLLQGSQKISPDFFSIITGIVVFMSALSLILYNFKPLRGSCKYLYLLTRKEYWKYRTKMIKEYWTILLKEKFKIKKMFFNNLKLKMKFRHEAKKYETYVAEKLALIKSQKKRSELLSQNELLDLYDEMSKRKFEFLKKKSDFGLNDYSDEKNKFSNTLYLRKTQFKTFKEELFTQFTSRLFKKDKLKVKGEN
ncbi:ABC transporter permease [Mycoplasmopsis glycophila]|uniref:ABC-type uncharacterized transport system, permease component n=1 Tax=Mycoplasmopsis glycophila TaxID=171285 RepID=A0A449AUF0_9BACT|nr:ABC transporter permease [Mycoplasmopsis glycophila]VEU70149.1 ABC-type uncharacterized transport system, permease component [Mycoplasmopsis glycophila]